MKYPAIGELDKLVKLRLWNDTPNVAFALDQNFDVGQDAWARIDPTSAALFLGTQQIEAGMTHWLTTWRTPTINERAITGQHVVEHEGIRYRVRRVSDVNGRRDFVLIGLEQLKAIDP